MEGNSSILQKQEKQSLAGVCFGLLFFVGGVLQGSVGVVNYISCRSLLWQHLGGPQIHLVNEVHILPLRVQNG